MNKVAIVVPNWNGLESLGACLESLQAQTADHQVVVVENGSTDGSIEFLADNFPKVTVLRQPYNLGFAGGVNVGIQYAIDHNYDFVALFNNDALADRLWLETLVTVLSDQQVGIATGTLLSSDGQHIDSTGDIYSVWGLPYPRGRGEDYRPSIYQAADIFGASGGASLYRLTMLQQIGLFDEDFFAYYEDVDVSFRAQLRGWKVRYDPTAIAYHQIGATSSKLKGFTTYQTMKNLPLLWFKNVPPRYFWLVGMRLALAQSLFLGRAISRRQGWPAFQGVLKGLYLLAAKTRQRQNIQAAKTVDDDYIWSIITHDLPPNADRLRKLRSIWRKFNRH